MLVVEVIPIKNNRTKDFKEKNKTNKRIGILWTKEENRNIRWMYNDYSKS